MSPPSVGVLLHSMKSARASLYAPYKECPHCYYNLVRHFIRLGEELRWLPECPHCKTELHRH